MRNPAVGPDFPCKGTAIGPKNYPPQLKNVKYLIYRLLSLFFAVERHGA